MIQISIEENTQKKLAALAGSLKTTQVREAFRGAAREVAMAERSDAPRKTGALRSAIKWFLGRSRVAPMAYAKVDNDKAPHASWVILGTKDRRRAKKVMRFKPAGRRKWVFRKSVGPMPANPFWFNTAGRVIQGVGDRLVATMQRLVEGQVKQA